MDIAHAPSVLKPAHVQDLARLPSELSPKTQDQDLVDMCLWGSVLGS